MKDLVNTESSGDELKDAPILKSLQNGHAYKAPEGYFDNLSTEVSNRISSPDKKGFAGLLLRPLPLAGISLAILFAVFIVNYEYFYPDQSGSQELSAQVTVDDLIESGYYSEMDEVLLTEAVSDYGLSEPDSSLHYEDYLIQTIDETLLTNEL